MGLTDLMDRKYLMQMLQEIHNRLDKINFIVNNINIIGGNYLCSTLMQFALRAKLEALTVL